MRGRVTAKHGVISACVKGTLDVTSELDVQWTAARTSNLSYRGGPDIESPPTSFRSSEGEAFPCGRISSMWAFNLSLFAAKGEKRGGPAGIGDRSNKSPGNFKSRPRSDFDNLGTEPTVSLSSVNAREETTIFGEKGGRGDSSEVVEMTHA